MDEVNQIDDSGDQEVSSPKAKPVPVPDPAPVFGSSLVSMLIWLALSSSIVGLAFGFWMSSAPAFVASAGLALFAGVGHRAVFSRSRFAKTVRRGLVRLPVLKNGEVQRIGAMAGAAARTCDRCESYDHSTGQHQIEKHGDFKKAAAFLTPSQMELTKQFSGAWSEERGFDKRGQPVDRPGPQWNQLGACRRHGSLVFGPHTCEEWS